MSWKQEAERLFTLYGREWSRIADEMMDYFPDLKHFEVKEKIRRYIRDTSLFKQQKTDDFQRSCLEYKADGSIISEKFITIRDGEEMTPKFILEAHGLKPSAWEVVSYKNNFWNSQLKGGTKQISYQSKLTAKPIDKGLDFNEIDKHFALLDRKHFTPVKYIPNKCSMMAEVNIADLHLGRLCWHGNTPENYDYKIAQETYYRLLSEIVEEVRHKQLEYILFVWSNDFFNSDNGEQTTTGGTRQDTDVRWEKMFNVGCEMLVRGIEMLKEYAPVKTFYIPSNHDLATGWGALKFIEAWFRLDDNVEINTDAYPRKYHLYGNTLLGFTHGDKENSTGNKEKASRLASLMPIEAAELWAQAKHREMHAAHLHSEQMIQEINGVIVRRIASPTAADTWHTTSGYIGSERKVQTFVYDHERGLMQTINTPV